MFEQLDWSGFETSETEKTKGRLPHQLKAYVQSFMVMVAEEIEYVTDLREYICDHPALIWLLEFRLTPANSRNGFDVQLSVPSARHLRRMFSRLPQAQLHQLIKQTVEQAVAIIPEFGQTVSIDTKHIYANVCQNNLIQWVKERYDPQRQPKGDIDCRLGWKAYHNQEGKSKDNKGEWLWGYGTGIAVSLTPDRDALVVAELTQPFNQIDITYANPLMKQTRQNLSFAPRDVTADAAFDAYYMYEGRPEGGITAIPLNLRGHTLPQLNALGHPLCECRTDMQPRSKWIEKGRTVQQFSCPACGRRRKMGVETGHLIRLRLDRSSQRYLQLYKLRTCVERINSQAAAMGIAYPKQRRLSFIARRNTLIYLVINLHALQRFRLRNPKLFLNPP